jgi:RNA polymerase sigma-70 factor (ECF subfamily)
VAAKKIRKIRYRRVAPLEAKALHSLRLIEAGGMSFLSEIRLEESFGPFVAYQRDLGLIPNLLRAQSLLPRVIEAQAVLENAICQADGSLSRTQRERILLCASAATHDAYCVALSSRTLLSQGMPNRQVDDLLNDFSFNDFSRAGLSPADVGLLNFCLKLTRHPLAIGSEDIEALRVFGFNDESIIEAVATTALAAYRSCLSSGLGPEPDFETREVPSAAAFAVTGLPHDSNHPPNRKGPYVQAPYLNPKAFEPFAVLYESHGFIPNFFRAQTLRPDLLAAETKAVAAILIPEDILTRAQKECILLVVSAANLNSYCVAMHCNMLRGLGMPAEEGDQIAIDHHQSGLSEADKALLDFAIKAGTQVTVSRDDVARLRVVGFTDKQILECVAVTALNNFANFVQMGLGIEPDFEPPPSFQNKAHLSLPIDRPIAGVPVVVPSVVIDDPDTALAAEARNGNLEAFEELIRRHTRLVYRALTAILGNQDHAQDAMQDVLLSAYQHMAGFEARSKFSTWLVSIARNRAIEYLRKLKREVSLEETAREDDRDFRPRQVRAWVDNPEQEYSRMEIQKLIERGIMALPAKYRTVVMLRDIEQLPIDEIARQLGLSVPAVKVRLFRGRMMLREWLAPHFVSTRRAAQ